MTHRKDWMTDNQWYCYSMLAEVQKGFHHIYGNPKPFGTGIKVSIPDGMATFDSDKLTRLVVAAHQWCVRVELINGGPNRIGICMWKRERQGFLYERHPKMLEALAGMMDQLGTGAGVLK